jgi:hypothetical protein
MVFGAVQHRRRKIDACKADSGIEHGDLAQLRGGTAAEVDNVPAIADNLTYSGAVEQICGRHKPIDATGVGVGLDLLRVVMTSAGSGSRGKALF